MSLEAQEGRIRSWCQATNADLVAVIRDGGVSGSRPLPKRPGGALVAELMGSRAPEADAVVVMRLDRLGRDAAETLALLKRFAYGKVGLVSLDDHLDLGTPQGRAMAAMVCVFAELERGLIGQRTSDALQEKKRQMRVYGNLPFGWDRDGDKLIKNRREQATLRMARRMYDSGLGFNEIAAGLNAKRRSPKYGRRWECGTVGSVLATSASLEGRPAPTNRKRRSVVPVDRAGQRASRRKSAPFGWTDTADGRLPDWSQQITLSRILELEAGGSSVRRIARVLRDEGHATTRGGEWDHSTVLLILATSRLHRAHLDAANRRTSDVLQEKKRQMRVYGPLPFGWDRDGDTLIKNRQEQGTLRMARSMHDAGLGYSEIASRLNAKRRKTKHGRRWDCTNVGSVLATSASLEGRPIPTNRRRRPEVPADRPGQRAAQRKSAPFGWTDTAEGRVPNWAQQLTLGRILELEAGGSSARKMASVLTDEGHVTVRGGAWDHSTVLAILATSRLLRIRPDFANQLMSVDLAR